MFRRSVLFLVLLLALSVSGFAQLSQQEQQDLAAYIRNNYTKRQVSIPMRDGMKLFAEVYEPKDKSQAYPIMLNRTPYSVGPYEADRMKTSLGPDFQFARDGVKHLSSGASKLGGSAGDNLFGRFSRQCFRLAGRHL